MFAAVLSGDGVAQGFRNQDVRAAMGRETTCRSRRQRESAAIGRVLKRLQVRGLVAKVPRTRRWRVTEPGRRIMGEMLKTYRRYVAPAA